MRLGEVMTRDVEVIGSDAPLVEAASKMKKSRRWTDPGLRWRRVERDADRPRYNGEGDG